MKTTHRLAAAFHSHADDAAFALCLAAFAVSFVGLVGSAGPAAVAGPQDNLAAAASGGPSPAGDSAGVYADGTAVYRLPGVTVSTSRAVEMARMERESRSARLASAGRGAS